MEDNRTEAATIDMSALQSSHDLDPKILEKLVGDCDLAFLNPTQRIMYLKARAEAAGLDYRTVPFQFIRLQGRTVLYATKTATDQLARNHCIALSIIDQKTENDIRMVTVHASTPDGRSTDEIGCVPVKGLQGAELANALMKAVTKAKRRAILSICGLGMMDETELDTVRPDPPLVAAPKKKKEAVESATPSLAPLAEPVSDRGNSGTTEIQPPLLDLDDRASLDDSPPEPPALMDNQPYAVALPDGKKKIYAEFITQAQVQRLYAAASSNGWAKADARKILAVFGYGSAKEIVQGEIYDIIYKALEGSTPKEMEQTIKYLELWRDEKSGK